MNKPKPKNDGSHPRRAAALARNENVDEAGVPLLTPEQNRQLKIMEALQERRRLDKLRAESNERVMKERRDWNR